MAQINELSRTTELEDADLIPVGKRDNGDTRGATLGTLVDYVQDNLTGLAGSGTVTSVALSAPTGLSVGGSPVTSSGTLALTYTPGYSIPTDALQATWTAKQAALVSGTNIKTVNGQSLLGSGDLTISGGGGGVSSVGVSVPTGLSVSGSPVTSSGTIAISYTSGYSIPTDAAQSNWNTAFGWGNHASAGYYAAASFNTDARAQVEAALVAGANVTITPAGSGATRTLTIAATGVGGSSDHGGLTGLADDDHTQYHNDARGDARYVQLSGFESAVAATAAVAANTAKVTNATHTGDVTGATALTIANDVVTNAKLANVATATIKGRATAGTGDPEDLTASQVRTLINVADGATANSSDATLLDRANHTGTQAQSTVTNLVTDLAKAPLASPTFTGTVTLPAGTVVNGVTLTTAGGTTNFLRADGTYAAPPGGGGATNLTYTASTRVIASDTGTDATLPIFTSTEAGLVPSSGGGTTAFLRADGTFAVPAGSGAVDSVNGQTGTVVLDADDVGALSTSSATTITTTKSTPVAADTVILFDSETVGNPPALASIGSLLLDTIPDLPPLGLWDYWYWWRAAANGAASSDVFTGAAVSSGTNNTALPTGGMSGFNDHGIFIRSGTKANGGYRYQTSSVVGQYFGGGVSRKYRCQFLWRTSFTGRTVRPGFHDSSTSADATDGVYFEILDAVCSAKTANNSTRTTAATTVTLSLDTAYTFDIDVNAAGTEARFRVYAGTSTTAILDQTITTNIPITSARTVGAGIVATEASTTASDIGILYGLGIGTIEAFQTRDVAGVLGDINAILASI